MALCFLGTLGVDIAQIQSATASGPTHKLVNTPVGSAQDASPAHIYIEPWNYLVS